MKKKNFYSLFLRFSIPIFCIIMLCCYIMKIEFEIMASICMIFVLFLIAMLLLNCLILEPKEHYDSVKNSVDKDNDEYIESFINKLSNDSKLKRLYTLRKLLSPIIVIPFSVIIGNIVRVLADKYYNYVVITLIILSIYSIYHWFKKTYQIDSYLKEFIFKHFTDRYKMVEILSDDELIKRTINSYLKMIKREKYEHEVNKAYKVDIEEKRFFTLHVYFHGHRSRVTIFYGLSIIIPCLNQELFYKTNDYMSGGLAYDYFDNCTPANNISDELKVKLIKIQNKYGKPFKISTVDGNIQIFCEQSLTTFGSFSKMKVYVTDYCKAIKCLFELSNVIENNS